MRGRNAWNEKNEATLRKLVGEGNLFYSEIAKKLGLREAAVRWKAKRLGLPGKIAGQAHRLGQWNCKHKHLARPLLLYYLKHSAAECKKRFRMSDSEFKSCLTRAYMQPALRGIRKETRDHSAWSKAQLVFLLRHSGLRPRKWVAFRIGRCNTTGIKERLQALGLSSRTLQGITLSQFIEAFGERPKFYLQTDAGPSGGLKTSKPTRWKIIPWVWLNQEIKAKRLKTGEEMCRLVAARAMFQEWIFGGNALKKMKRIVKECGNEK